MIPEYYELCYERIHVTFEIIFLRSNTPILSDPKNEAACFTINPNMETISKEKCIPLSVIKSELISYVTSIAQKMLTKPIEILEKYTTGNCIAVKFPVATT